MIKSFKILNRFSLVALVLFFAVSSRSVAATSPFSSKVLLSTNTPHSSQSLPFLNYSSKRYSANRLVEAPTPPSANVPPVIKIPLSHSGVMGETFCSDSSSPIRFSRLLPLRI